MSGGQGVHEGGEGQSVAVLRLYVSVLEDLRELDLLLVREGQGSLKILKARVLSFCAFNLRTRSLCRTCPALGARRAWVLEDVDGQSLVVLRLYVSVLEFLRELDLLWCAKGKGP